MESFKFHGIMRFAFKRIGRQDEQDEIWKVLILVEAYLRSLITVVDEIYLICFGFKFNSYDIDDTAYFRLYESMPL